MLITSVISIGIKFRIPITTQRLQTLMKMYSTSSGSSSDSSSDASSDSDSDTEKIKKKKPVADVPKKSLDILIDNLLLKEKKEIDVAIPVKEIIKQDKSPVKEKMYEVQLSQAAQDIANVLNMNKGETKTQLLNRLSNIYKEDSKKKKHENLSKKQDKIISEHKFSTTSKYKDNYEPWKYKANIARKFKADDKYEISIIKQLQMEAKREKHKAQKTLKKKILNKRTSIFKDMKESTTNIPKLSMWESLEKRELDLILNHSPKNIFQEMIQWTESGILWKFPIDNEIGMEEESNVHFSEHVFLERHLKDWCPKSGPIRHFMELVCIGLSKNPYLTVNEKINHITWYKEYFKEKKELLTELGAMNVSFTTKEQITT